MLLNTNIFYSYPQTYVGQNVLITLLKKLTTKLGLLKKFKSLMDILSQMHVYFIRPQLEYAAELWAGCTKMDTEKLERVQLHAARIVRGLTSIIIASRKLIYFETG